ncbi:MAG: hypothetical protein Q4D13_05610 [Erysipelotrichaceae bacterium]|nr:hypothetical protein [Erysipelotrichaceae bacterium]
MEIKTSELEEILLNKTNKEYIEEINKLNEISFSDYYKNEINSNGISQNEIFYKCGISDSYGYKILSGEKHTSNKDLIIMLCVAGNLDLEKTQRCLKLYGMSPLYIKIKREALIMKCINNHNYNLYYINQLLENEGYEILGNR